MTDPHSILFIGGARSGKSRLAQRHAEDHADATTSDLIFIATAQAFDDEMRDRIAWHQRDRDARWRTVEAPLDLPQALTRADRSGRTILVDCLTLWTSNILLAGHNMGSASDELVGALAASQSTILMVTNEVGWGIVPDNALARRFRDVAGRLNQRVAATVGDVRLIVAGCSLSMK